MRIQFQKASPNRQVPLLEEGGESSISRPSKVAFLCSWRTVANW